MKLPGIGRKCADIVLQFAFGIDTIAVDTYVHRALPSFYAPRIESPQPNQHAIIGIA